MYPFNFIAIVAIISLMVIASVDVLVIRKRELGHVVKKVVITGGVPIADETLRGNEGDGLLVNKKGGLLVRRNSKNTKPRRDSSGHSDKSALIGGLTPTILELYGGVLDIAGPTVVEIPVVKDTPLVQSSFPKVASTVPGVIIDLGKTLDNTLHL